ncbi:MAG: caspase family protein, partial [Proteobacteria bacterium]|nr:caspase family protein [Pseudomonadota bacterium]
MKRILVCLAAVIGLSGLATAERGVSVAAKERRTALVIGNSDYKIGRLKNPANDAEDIARVLRQSDFNVTLLLNVNQEEMDDAISEFGNGLRGGGVGLFYFAGHGIQLKGRNYLIPIGSDIKRQRHVKYRAVNVGEVLAEMGEARNGLNILVLDACRDNPLPRSFRTGKRGLAEVDPPKGTLVAFSTALGDVASDGTGRNSPFARHFIKYAKAEGLHVETMFRKISADVQVETGGKQVPWRQSSFTGDFYFSGGGTAGATVASVSTRPKPAPSKKRKRRPSSEETELWNLVGNSTVDELEAYLAEYPNGFYRKQAEERIWYLTYSTVEN